MFLRFGKKYTDDYVQSAEEALKKALEDTGIGNSTDVDLDMNELLLTLSIVLICIGLFFGIISLLGVLGACCQIKCLLVMNVFIYLAISIAEYVVICLAIAIAEVVCVILLYTDDTYGCCGVDAYTDFDNTEKWAHTETTNGVTKTILLIIGAIIVLCSGGKDGKAKERPSSGKVLRKNQVAPGSIPGFRAGRRRY
ncbi:hypothetical protein MAR_021972 [Mya arenaria]|uniref:Uncharacterized protein n=1 Tax=Mya arenaria TaxID=6604 RepID=A0ABY7E969_MYAAR|nr:hypothetical protein MAR_021972 [Mya arenaria]